MPQETEQGWLRPESLADARPARGASPETAAMYDLRPLSLGEVLDRTFALYRSRFWMFAGISAVSGALQAVIQAVSLTNTHTLVRSVSLDGPVPTQGPLALRGLATAQIETGIALLLFFLVAAVTQAATTLAMSAVYLHQPASAEQSLRVAVRRWYRWIGIALWQLGSMLWIPALATIPGLLLIFFGTRATNPVMTASGAGLVLLAALGGFAAGFILYLRNALAVPAAIVERLTIRPAMRRSKVLAAGAKGRMFVVLLIAGCLLGVVGVLESPATILILFAPKQQHYLAQAITLALSFVGRTVVAPVALIGLTLVYFDQRVRKEAFDLQLMLEGSRATGNGGASPLA